ncbi:MAG TPA: type II toxin-antitoxin system VapC family toxin [Candidatus Acidoferrales bacterium]|jgi:PIN domain nuclease of toxin-antitoxin system|nr:type II toxin-antitoxin system VapC family toxin [Candidatus Acidoferrales bacterium]
MILLDTHALIWLAFEPAKLSKAAREAIHQSARTGGLGISAITLWEAAWLVTHRRVDFTGTPEAFLEEISSRTAVFPITSEIAILANQLPATYSSDPSDRLIGGTALAESIPLITKDRSIRNHKQIKTIW